MVFNNHGPGNFFVTRFVQSIQLRFLTISNYLEAV